ncbi:hypothetical protein [Enterococcus rivorum]|uniref:Uncharacterized protein n=1 Tax=Enterococcus rivorum TaxID=762845 RepID=A0A1E5L0B9_9ENTE|nr:hypothetical protein [Enterococcus rivorum]MBP2098830.1 hypothetical protein [Enterococcus rivorum]OEH83561.1 hypothetical protein BCR26_08765 [Enterococcus rivorum]
MPYLEKTLFTYMKGKPTKNNILKSIYVENTKKNTAHIICEPYDNAYNPDKAINLLKRRRKNILKTLNVESLYVEIYDEWGLIAGGEIGLNYDSIGWS